MSSSLMTSSMEALVEAVDISSRPEVGHSDSLEENRGLPPGTLMTVDDDGCAGTDDVDADFAPGLFDAQEFTDDLEMRRLAGDVCN